MNGTGAVLATVTREAAGELGSSLESRRRPSQRGRNRPPRQKAMTISEQFWWLAFFPEPNGFSCPLLQHTPTRSIAFALTKPVHFDRCTRQDRHREHSSCRTRKRHGLTCHPIRRSPLSVSLEIRRRKRSGRSPCFALLSVGVVVSQCT